MRGILILLAIVLTPPAAAREQDEKSQTIVITGTSLADSEARLAACIARHCSPKEDIEASLAHAENQFVAGDYAGARRTLGKSRGRNNRYAETLPIEVSDLNRAHGRVSNFDGRPDSGQLMQIEALDALKAGLDDNDARVLMQRLMVGDEFARAGRLRAAEDMYSKVAKEARKTGQLRVLGHALLRDAVVHGAVASVRPSFRTAAERKIARVEATQEPELADFRHAAKILRAKLAVWDQDTKALDDAIAAIPPQKIGKPLLIYSPPIRLEKLASGSGGATPASEGGPEWIDVRFRIAANGTVHDIETLRDSGNVGGNWPKLALQALAQRRYAPLVPFSGSDGATRIERFSYVHDLVTETGSRIARRSSSGRITSLDLTHDVPET